MLKQNDEMSTKPNSLRVRKAIPNNNLHATGEKSNAFSAFFSNFLFLRGKRQKGRIAPTLRWGRAFARLGRLACARQLLLFTARREMQSNQYTPNREARGAKSRGVRIGRIGRIRLIICASGSGTLPRHCLRCACASARKDHHDCGVLRHSRVQ